MGVYIAVAAFPIAYCYYLLLLPIAITLGYYIVSFGGCVGDAADEVEKASCL